MKAKTAIKKTLILELDEWEADWLRGYLQNNPFESPEEEDSTHARYRKDAFEALDEAIRSTESTS